MLERKSFEVPYPNQPSTVKKEKKEDKTTITGAPVICSGLKIKQNPMLHRNEYNNLSGV